MPKQMTRSKWVPELARSIGWDPQRLRILFNKKGLFAPFGDDDSVGLKILEDAKINTAKYRAAKAAATPATPTAPAATAGAPTGKAKKAKKTNSTGAKISAAFRKKLVRRLARLLPQGDTAYGQQKVRDILAKHGMKKPWNHDKNEAPALAIFQKEGIPIDKFEYANPGTGTALVPATPSAKPVNGAAVVYQNPEALVGNPGALVASYNELLAKHDDLAKRHNDLLGRTKTSAEILHTYAIRLVSAQYHRQLPVAADPLEYPMTALNILRGSTRRPGSE